MGAFLQNYLQDRTVRVCIGGTTSNIFTEANRVSQGSVLAVTLFLISMNSVFQKLPKNIYIYVFADDIIIVVAGRSIKLTRRKAQAVAIAIEKWATSVRFTLSPTKCSITHCCNGSHRPTGTSVFLSGTNIPYAKEPRILDVTFDNKLTFLPHFRNVKSDYESRLKLMRTISNGHPKWNRSSAINVSKALIRSRIYYGIEATGLRRNNLITTLAPTYNRYIRIASNHLPSTPANAACVEAGQLPFRWQTAIVIFRRALGYLEKTSGQDCMLLDLAKQLHQLYTGKELPQLARFHSARNKPWYNTNIPAIDTSLHLADLPPVAARARFHDNTNSKYKNHYHLYTDGSKTATGVGIGISGPEPATNTSLQLPTTCSIFSTEAATIAWSLITKPSNQPTVVFSDSLSVITALQSGNCRHPFIQAIENHSDAGVTICWVPAHCGIQGNKTVDRLAALGRSSALIQHPETPAADITKSFTNQVATRFTRHWGSSWGHTQKIKGDTTKWTDRSSRAEQRILSRLRVGHTKTTHTHTISRADSPTCETCYTRKTVEHQLVNCLELADLRRQHDLPPSLRDILCNDPVREEVLLPFLKDADLFQKV
ncbi:uncharacterized protein LOC131688120 [Topomyia yanbarensis]|uniref:uncharacterized protein LOC131688120 n=1 Tax=Topomyia yanbarensis TaxID=2498891 RepID=UPI00273C441C|nr:uncharacterized protein LOC131688120 [Topomyia yanbarensis]